MSEDKVETFDFESLFYLLTELYSWDPNILKYLTIPQSLMYLKKSPEEQGHGYFKRGRKFTNKAAMMAFLNGNKE